MVTRHQFLARIHHLLQPRLYMEVGVHTGESLRLASGRAIGIDPQPLVASPPANATIVAMTSDDYFAGQTEVRRGDLDFGFIDGMHQFEYALRDFMNMEALATPRSVIVFDDVLPTTQYMTNRNMVPGDWTGDVWKVAYILRDYRDDLNIRMVDTFPTGTMMVYGLDPMPLTDVLHESYDDIVDYWMEHDEVPSEVLFRTDVLTADQAIAELREKR